MSFLNKTIYRRILLSILIVSSLPLFAAAQTQTSQIKTFLQTRMRKRRVPGLQVAVVRNGKIVLLAALGTANIENSVPVTNQTVFSINSATKAFTGVAAMQLVADGKLDLEAAVSQYLDGLPVAWRQVKIRQLLTHTSGLPDILIPPKAQGTGSLVGTGGEDSAWATVQTLPPDFAAGEQYRYNQTNYVLLGKIIDKLGGKPFVRFIKERQFDAVKMPQTAFGDSRDVVMNRAQAYRYSQGALSAYSKNNLERAFDEFTAFIRTAGGLNSTAEEIARWIISLEQNRILDKDNLNKLWSPGKFNNEQPTPWALGWVAVSRPSYRAVAGIGGRRSAFFVYPDDGLAIVVLTNLAGANPEEFIDEIAGFYLPRLAGGSFSLQVKQLRSEVTKRGFNRTNEAFDNLKRKNPQFQPLENDLNQWGGQLMTEGDLKEAIEIFKLNVRLYPKSANVYDSLAEAYEIVGKRDLAVTNYKRSLELDPQNTNAVRHLEQLESVNK